MQNLLAKRGYMGETPRARLDAVWYVDADASYQVSKKRGWNQVPYIALRTLTGQGELRLHGGERITAESNTLVLLRAEELRFYGADKAGWQFYWFAFDIDRLAPELVNRAFAIRMSAQEQAELERCFQSLGGDTAYAYMVAESLFHYLLADWLHRAEQTDKKAQAAQDLLSLLEKGRCGRMSIPALAREAGMCERSFRDAVHAATGMSPKAYMRKSEMAAAMELLRTTDLSITEIAACFDYASPLYFSRVFKNYFGLSPQYVRNGIEL